ncbi:MAG: hypothetical protein JWQ38_2251 [Flavipsychrobacter sp.]|nr:hypothetical protein [Flavipsychrobacter sp.]
MKKIFTCFAVLFAFVAAAHAQHMQKAKLSPLTQRYLQEAAKQNAPRVPNYVYKNINNKPYISALIKVGTGADEGKLKALGAYVGTKAGSVWTVQIPLESVAAFTNIPGISYIALDAPIYPLMDSARRQTRADSAQQGINMPAGVSGKGVVMGIIDAGFDFNHPAMFDTTYSQYRIKRIWTQKSGGTPPAGFSYGNEMTDTNVMKARGSDTVILSHGTHVAGIAAGSGYGGSANNMRYRGMAYESDIVLVGIMPAPGQWVAGGESDIIDGISYIFTYAASTGQPAVVNLSWGSTLGPHDGSSLFSEACDALTGPGKLFVCAAGNNGQDTVHLQKTFTSSDTSVSTFVTFSSALDTDHLFTWVDVWGDTGNTFCLNVKLYDNINAIDSTLIVCLDDNVHDFKLVGTNLDTCYVTITTAISEYNSKPHAFVEFHSRVHDNICLTATSSAGVVNMWEGYVYPPTGYYGHLKKLGYPWAVSGDVNMTVSDIGSTRSAITVGAYTSKPSFINISGSALSYSATRYKIAPFSSLGPTEDSRIKPDITAPGFGVVSSVNSYDTTYNVGGPGYSSVISAYTDPGSGRIFRYGILAGTSMAAPCASGIIAMMLQLDPTLGPDGAKDIINTTAIKDIYTTALPPEGNTTWGHGKINAYGVINYLVHELSVKNLNMEPMNCFLYPNPNKGSFTLSYTANTPEQLTIEIMDISGKVVSRDTWFVNKGGNAKQISAQTLSKGVYLTKVSSAKGYNIIKTVVQ